MGFSHSRSGFKLMDLAVVLTIGVICFGVFFSHATIRTFLADGPLGAFLPGRSRGPSTSTYTINNLKQMGLAAHSYNDVHKTLPPAFVSPLAPMGAEKRMAWPSGLQGSCHLGLGPYYETNANVLVTPADSSIYTPQTAWPITNADPSPFSSQSANFYVFGGPDPDSSRGLPPYTPLSLHEFADGTSNTILFTTCFAQFRNGNCKVNQDPTWPTSPFTASLTWHRNPALSLLGVSLANANNYSASGIFVGLADGSGRRINAAGGPGTTYANAMLPSDGKLPEWDY